MDNKSLRAQAQSCTELSTALYTRIVQRNRLMTYQGYMIIAKDRIRIADMRQQHAIKLLETAAKIRQLKQSMSLKFRYRYYVD
jgi:hypothetical protein